MLTDDDLPDMWSHADFEGGDPDTRSYAQRARDAEAAGDHESAEKWRAKTATTVPAKTVLVVRDDADDPTSPSFDPTARAVSTRVCKLPACGCDGREHSI